MWLLLGLGLLVAEILTPGTFFLVFFGAGAVLVGLLTLLGLAGGVLTQWILFSVISVISLLVFRKPLLAKVNASTKHRDVDSLVGELVLVAEPVAPGEPGKAELRGSSWNVRSDSGQALEKGRRYKVSKVDGLTLWVGE